jgi:hypothetical protein
MAVIDREAPLQFLRTAFEPEDWIAVFLKSYESGRVTQRVGPLSWVMHPRFQAWLRFKNAQRFNVYIGVNSITAGQRTRTRESIGAVRHVFLEADHDGAEVLATVAARRDLPEPSYLLHSSRNRIHLFWRVSGFAAFCVEAIQKRLARELGTDSAATSVSQTTRLPGFLNHKYSPPNAVWIEYCNCDHLYTPDDFPAIEPVTEPVGTPSVHKTPTSSTLDPVERARRYLARVPPAIAGEHGDLRTFRVCCRLVRGFALDDEQAIEILAGWNARCQPPWSEPELIDKLRRARRYGREPIAGLLQGVR